ncbi:MAG: IS66 family transposase [Planctomycetaceae bacterium]
MQDASHIPTDLDACQSLILEQARALLDMQKSTEDQSQKIVELQLQIDKLVKQLYGPKSERSVDDPNQLTLNFGDDEQSKDAIADAVIEAEKIVQEFTVRREITKKKKPRNEQLPAHLERYEVTAPSSAADTHCAEHGERNIIGYDKTETLEFERPKLRVRVTLYPKYACASHAECGIAQPERATGLVEGNRYGASIAAEIIAAKYDYHLPFYRQQNWFAGSGWCPTRSTLLNILTAAECVLRPLADYYRTQLMQEQVIGCDETRVTLLTPAGLPALKKDASERDRRRYEVLAEAIARQKPSLTARMWAYRGVSLPINVFDFTVSRERYGPDDVLSEFRGFLMADCWTGFQQIGLRSDLRITRVACMSHARRKVFDCRTTYPAQASVLLAMFRQLYDIEDRGKELSPENRRTLRQTESIPVLNRMGEYLKSDAVSERCILPKSDFAAAVNYIRNHWEQLQLYTTNGLIPIDNNDVEQLMKQVATGRKNWLFIGSADAGERAANLLTLVSTAHRNDLDVWMYVKDALDQLLAGSTDYESLRADVWKQSHPEAVRTYRSDERRDTADRNRLTRAQRRLASAKKLAAAKLAAKKNEGEPPKSKPNKARA